LINVKSEVLILGNGISRISFKDLITDWPGEVWGCNRSYLDYPEKLTRLNGHTNVMYEAAEYREKHNLSFDIWGGHLGPLGAADKGFTCSKRFCKDSGTAMIAQALHEGFNIAACGFDLGGPDLHSPRLGTIAKHNWIKRWRTLLETYGRRRIRFIGYDHLPYLLSGRPPTEYSNCYRAGEPHLYDADYIEVWEQWSGKSAFSYKEISIVKVKVKYTKTGQVAEMDQQVAAKMQSKGKVEILKAPKTEKPEKPTKKEIILKLLELKIDFDKKAKVEDLLKLLPEVKDET